MGPRSLLVPMRTAASAYDREHGRSVDASPEADHARADGKVAIRAVAFLVDAQDQVAEPRRAILRQLPRNIPRGPETDDLDQPAPGRIVPVLEREVGEDQRAGGGDRLGLADDLPLRRNPREVPGKGLLDPAVEPCVATWSMEGARSVM